MMKRIFSLLLALLLPAAALADGDIAGDILRYEARAAGTDSIDAWIADALPGTMGVGGEWYALALHQQGYDLPGCLAALEEYLEGRTVRSATSRLKFALVRLALGGALPDGWHADIGAQGVMSWAWGLHLLSNGCEAPVTADEAIAALLALQLPDGGWANSGSRADPDVTAMVLQSLAPHASQADAAPAIEAALACLSGMQMDTGEFASYGVPCPESAAQVLTALSALGIDGLSDPRFVKNGATLLDGMLRYRLEDGAFAHTLGGPANATATMQVFLGLTAYQRCQDGRSPLYLLEAPGEMTATLGWKAIAAIAIVAAGAATALLLFLLGKRSPKNLLAIALVMALALAAVYFLDIRAADDYYSTAIVKEGTIGTVTLSIRCDTVAGRSAHIPADGVILAETAFPIAQGDTAFTVLTDAARSCGIHIERSGGYITGIANLYEFDHGALSGWIFCLNGETSSQGSDQIPLRPGDVVEWRYTLDLGRDIRTESSDGK